MEGFSPRMWGCTDRHLCRRRKSGVFPTHVGVYRFQGLSTGLNGGFPHACGGVPITIPTLSNSTTFSPRMWGCTVSRPDHSTHSTVFPTHVGVYLSIQFVIRSVERFPHACGGVPAEIERKIEAANVFPTHVGVYLMRSGDVPCASSFPHACGGVPNRRNYN